MGHEPFGFQNTLLKQIIIIPTDHMSGTFQDHSMQGIPIRNSPGLGFTGPSHLGDEFLQKPRDGLAV